MKSRKILKRIFFAVFLIFIAAFVWLAFNVFPAISGYGSKNLCSAVYLQYRDPASVINEDLGDFPKSLGTYTVNEKDSSVTGSVWGLAKRKTIYRKGIGCTLINDFTEEEIRKQQFVLPEKQEVNRDTVPWPFGDKLPESNSSPINHELLNKAVDNGMNETSADGKPAYTRAVLVLYDGNIVAEKYAPGFDKNTVMLGWSMSKSLTAAMIGILVKQNKLSIDAPAPVASWANTKKQKITLKNLLQQTTGLDFTENYTRPSSVTKMLFSKGDMAAYTEALPLKYQPGTVFNYSSGNSNILSKIIRNTVGEKEYAAFPYKELFHKINAYSFLIEPDASGTYIGSSYSYATARDFARFGLLYYNNGIWKGEQILPENWVKESIQPSSADKQKHYGYQFWLNGFDPKDPNKRWFPDVPADMFFADGYGGQDIYIIPSEKLIVVRLGVHTINENKFLREIIRSFH
ncbi:MAG TPA: serine hydrolase [Chitinophagaceae bacterium]|nr:serine hydrolase [Chitinophagaceae bacterium]